MAIYKTMIRQKNQSGQYDYILPETTIDQVNGLQLELDNINQAISEVEDEELRARVEVIELELAHLPTPGTIDTLNSRLDTVDNTLLNKANVGNLNVLANNLYMHSNQMSTITTSGHVYHGELLLTLTVENWSANAPYTQSVSASGILNTDNPLCAVKYSTGDTLVQKKAIRDDWNKVDDVQCTVNALSFICFDAKPTVPINVIVKVIR